MIINDPIQTIDTIVSKMCPDKKFKIVILGGYIPNIYDENDKEEYVGFCHPPIEEKDIDSYRIVLSSNLNMNDIPVVLLHEFSHMIAGKGHNDEFKSAAERLLEVYIRCLDLYEYKLHKPSLKQVISPRLNIVEDN